ncbi:MAG: patatin-like phospholipase family protein [Acetobacteraceae bacterium]|nr:patatin-like phospholipase family protein [Acetobacteraceae bacterium]
MPFRRKPSRPSIALALQGGGSFGAFTWGVLDRLLEDGEAITLDAVSGASAGAVNAVLLADGLAAGGPAEARRRLERFWHRVSAVGAPAGPLASLGRAAVPRAAAAAALHLSIAAASPYQFNPLGLDPLRDILAEEVDFGRLRQASPVRLLIAATRVRDGEARLFREYEITLEAVLASACLPFLHHSVEIEGEAYWDGGYSANPPLLGLIRETRADDILLVQVAPVERDGAPRSSPDIALRSRELAFASPLRKELEALAGLCELCRKAGGLLRPRPCRRLARLRLHHVIAGQAVGGLEEASALDTSWAFLTRLKEGGRQAAGEWLARAPLAA